MLICFTLLYFSHLKVNSEEVFLNYAGIKYSYILIKANMFEHFKTQIFKNKYMHLNIIPFLYQIFCAEDCILTVTCKYFKLLTVYSNNLTYYFNCTMDSKYLQ